MHHSVQTTKTVCVLQGEAELCLLGLLVFHTMKYHEVYIYIVLSCSIPFQPKASPNTSPNTAAAQKGRAQQQGRPGDACTSANGTLSSQKSTSEGRGRRFGPCRKSCSTVCSTRSSSSSWSKKPGAAGATAGKGSTKSDVNVDE